MLARDPHRAARRRHRARYSVWTFVAPVVLLVAIVMVVSVVGDMLDARRAEEAARPSTTTAADATTEAPATTGSTRRRFYRVKEGESLSTIAERFETTVDRLTELNPDIDPLKLQPGQRIRVR